MQETKRILDMVAQLIGEDICLWNMSFFAKPALNGKKTPFHQDGEYWPIQPLATCTVWIAIDEATVENGCLRYIPGSHNPNRLLAHEVKDDPNYTLNRELLKTEYDESQAEDLLLPAGGMALHDVYIAHGSEENRSPHPRRGMTLRLMPTSSVYDRELAVKRHAERGGLDMSHHSIFLLRGRGPVGQKRFPAPRLSAAQTGYLPEPRLGGVRSLRAWGGASWTRWEGHVRQSLLPNPGTGK